MSTLVEQFSEAQRTTATRPRLLLVAYSFPPVGGAGVQRPVKWVKNLGRCGWDVTVLTTSNPSVPARDESLLADIPEDVLVLRAKTWEPDYRVKQGLVTSSTGPDSGWISKARAAVKGLVRNSIKMALQPDPQVLWVPNAIRVGRRILSEITHDAILVTAPAYSSFFVGIQLKKQFGLPLVLDFRDEWDMSGRYLENAQRDWFSRIVQNRMQNWVLKKADAVVATTQASTANLAEKLGRVNRSMTPSITIYNGFDEEDFDRESDLPQSVTSATSRHGKFRLLYTGTLWNLTTVEPLVQAILKLNETNPQLLSMLEFVCVGRKTADQSAILERIRQTSCQLQLMDYCPHSQILEFLRSTDAMCLLLSDVPGAERVVPGKLFEYLANRKEMLAIVPNGETADIVRRYFPEGHLEPKNVDGIVQWISRRLESGAVSQTEFATDANIDEFSRRTQTRRLVELLNEVTHANCRRVKS